MQLCKAQVEDVHAPIRNFGRRDLGHPGFSNLWTWLPGYLGYAGTLSFLWHFLALELFKPPQTLQLQKSLPLTEKKGKKKHQEVGSARVACVPHRSRQRLLGVGVQISAGTQQAFRRHSASTQRSFWKQEHARSRPFGLMDKAPPS